MVQKKPPIVRKMEEIRERQRRSIYIETVKDSGAKDPFSGNRSATKVALRALELFALVTVFLTVYATFVDLGDRQGQRITQAWQLVTTTAQGNSGKAQALGYLNSEDWRSRWVRSMEESVGLSLARSSIVYQLLDNGIIPRKKRISLTGINISSLKSRAYLVDSKLSESDLRGATLQGADLERAELERANLWEANLQGASLYSAKLGGSILGLADLQGAEFSIPLYNSEIVLRADFEGIQVLKKNFNRAILAGIDLSNIEFKQSTFKESNLHKANLQGADLGISDLRRANLTNADLRGASLLLADLEGANLESSDLRGADLFHANLKDANISGAAFLREKSFFVLEPTTLPDEFIDDIPRWHGKSGAVYLRGRAPVGLSDEDLRMFTEVECWAPQLFRLPECVG